MRRLSPLLLLVAGCVAGCAAGRPAGPAAPLLGDQLRAQDEALVGQRFRTVLDFENKADATFVSAAAAFPSVGHTGTGGLHCGGPATINVSSLLFGLQLPGDFTLVGGYVRPAGGVVSATLVADGRTIARTERVVPAGVWALAAIDLTDAACQRALPDAKDVRLILDGDGGFELDDVMLIDNRRTLVDTPEWTIRNDGLSLVIRRTGRPPLKVGTTANGRGGWLVQETSPLRVRLQDAQGTHFRTLLPDGRSVLDGRPDGGAWPAAELIVGDATVRLDRETPGDADNDGFNERRAAYQLIANGPRVRFTFQPQSQADSPLFEIRGLAKESGIVTADGKLIVGAVRSGDGTLLVRLPGRVSRPVEVTVGVRGD